MGGPPPPMHRTALAAHLAVKPKLAMVVLGHIARTTVFALGVVTCCCTRYSDPFPTQAFFCMCRTRTDTPPRTSDLELVGEHVAAAREAEVYEEDVAEV
jgi:hypothetical protein